MAVEYILLRKTEDGEYECRECSSLYGDRVPVGPGKSFDTLDEAVDWAFYAVIGGFGVAVDPAILDELELRKLNR